MRHHTFMQRMRVTLCGIFLALGLSPVAAQPDLSRIVTAEVVPGWRNASGEHMAGLRLTLAPGWKTYWRVPGEGGIPPVFSWRGSRNLRDVAIVWPTPKVYDDAGMQSLGYDGQVVLPLSVMPKASDRTVKLKGRVKIGVCLDICVPETLTIDAELPPSGARHPEIVAALVDRPYTSEDAGVTAARCSVRPIEGGLGIRAEIAMPSAGAPEAVVIEAADPQLYVSQARTERRGDTLTAEARIYHMEGGAFSLSRDTTRLTVIGANYAVDIRGCSGS